MKKEDLISQLELLPDGTEVYVRQGERITEPHLCFYDVEPHPAPLKLVVYIETFIDALDRYVDKIPEEFVKELTKPCHEHLHHVCHHGRDIMGCCGSCDTEEEGNYEIEPIEDE